MQPTAAGSSSGGGGAELSRGGQLARFRSAPASWLETLLEGEEEEAEDDPLKPNHSLTQLLSSNSTAPTTRSSSNFVPSADPGLFDSGSAASSSVFLRQNSSPADFPSSAGYDGYFSGFGIPPNYDYLSPSAASVEVASVGKRPRDDPSARFLSHLKEEQIQSGMGNLLDAEMEKLLEDSVPCRVRAKRGCATHPRSIAERVRRTRISNKIRKLQELVPNMDKQTNTADMLEEAVAYVKLLQDQIRELTEHQRKCKCLARE
nr:basic helix-loop-helix transcription factor [Loropetalum chinense var. rubrum]